MKTLLILSSLITAQFFGQLALACEPGEQAIPDDGPEGGVMCLPDYNAPNPWAHQSRVTVVGLTGDQIAWCNNYFEQIRSDVGASTAFEAECRSVLGLGVEVELGR